MSLAAYQRAQVALLVDRGAVDRVRGGDLAPWADDLTDEERERLVAQAADPGLLLSRKLHQGWRLTKLMTLLPTTFAVGDPALLADLVGRYWRDHRPQGLYFEAEAEAFARLVAAEPDAPDDLRRAAALEGARVAVGRQAQDRGHSLATSVSTSYVATGAPSPLATTASQRTSP